MITYPIPMVPGPVHVPASILDSYRVDFGSSDFEPEFLELYNQTEKQLQLLLQTNNMIAILTGEGMLALWSALKSCIRPGDRVLSIATGLFGFGLGEMAGQIGAEVKVIGMGYDQTICEMSEIEKAIAEFKPKMITVVHCETPSGTLNPLDGVGQLKRKYQVPLLYVDAVSSAGGVSIPTDEWAIDLLLGGSQKCFSAPPSISFVAMSEKAREVVNEVNYVGYDALKPFLTAQENFYFPYTPHWHGVSALSRAVELILNEGPEQCFARHAAIAEITRAKLKEIGYRLFPADGAVPSPTVTAVYVPDRIPWLDFDQRLRCHGLVVGGNYGPLAGQVFRLGHMGSQADRTSVEKALEILEEVYQGI